MPLYVELKKMKFTDPNMGIKVILMIHFLLTILGAMGSFSPFVYLFYNLCLILPLSWIVYGKAHEDCLKMAITMNMCSIILDAIYIVLALEDSRMRFRETVSSVIAIIHLIFRPFSILFLLKYDNKHKNNQGEPDDALDSV